MTNGWPFSAIGLRPRPQDFRGIDSVFSVGLTPRRKAFEENEGLPKHVGLGYSLSGCVPAEPDAASPATRLNNRKS